MNSHVQDPYNVADKNAIEVRHSRGQRVGYVAKALAEKLTPLLAARKIRLAATAGPGSSFVNLLPYVPRSRCGPDLADTKDLTCSPRQHGRARKDNNASRNSRQAEIQE